MNAQRWRARQDELRAAMMSAYFDEDCNCFTQDHLVGGTLLWPVRFVAPGSARAQSQADVNFIPIRRAMRGKVSAGTLEARVFGKTWITTRAEVERYRLEHQGRRGRPKGG